MAPFRKARNVLAATSVMVVFVSADDDKVSDSTRRRHLTKLRGSRKLRAGKQAGTAHNRRGGDPGKKKGKEIKRGGKHEIERGGKEAARRGGKHEKKRGGKNGRHSNVPYYDDYYYYDDDYNNGDDYYCYYYDDDYYCGGGSDHTGKSGKSSRRGSRSKNTGKSKGKSKYGKNRGKSKSKGGYDDDIHQDDYWQDDYYVWDDIYWDDIYYDDYYPNVPSPPQRPPATIPPALPPNLRPPTRAPVTFPPNLPPAKRPPTRAPQPTPAPTYSCLSKQDDRGILKQFYITLDGDNWFTNTGWMLDYVHHCHWYGVICGDQYYLGRVTGIHLPVNNLNGPLELTRVDELCSLSSLDLASQRGEDVGFAPGLTGRVPDWRYNNLPNMVYMDLSGNSLTGLIPTTISNLFFLRQLYLHDNTIGLFNGINFPIPTEIGLMRSLGVLDLRINLFGGTIPRELGSLYSLGVLRLQQNNIVDIIEANHPICQLRVNYHGTITGPVAVPFQSQSGRHGRPQTQAGHNPANRHFPDDPPYFPDGPLFPDRGVLSVFETDCLTEVTCACCTDCF